eukprot:COSAG02_NODE_64252_length_261_cov_0.623457_1_plen_79_part_01
MILLLAMFLCPMGIAPSGFPPLCLGLLPGHPAVQYCTDVIVVVVLVAVAACLLSVLLLPLLCVVVPSALPWVSARDRCS